MTYISTLMENKLVTVPRSVFQLRSLKKILLDHNSIVNLPDEIDPDPLERFGLQGVELAHTRLARR